MFINSTNGSLANGIDLGCLYRKEGSGGNLFAIPPEPYLSTMPSGIRTHQGGHLDVKEYQRFRLLFTGGLFIYITNEKVGPPDRH